MPPRREVNESLVRNEVLVGGGGGRRRRTTKRKEGETDTQTEI